jgi:hypothetical protein
MWSIEVPKWMITAARIATGNRRRVLENGPDVMNSEDEDAVKENHGEELTGMYAPGCSSLDQARLTEQQAQEQRAAAFSAPEPERKPTPGTSDDDDWSWMTEDQRRKAETARRMMEKSSFKALLAPAHEIRKPDPVVQAPAAGAPLVIKKAAASPRALADQPKGAKAPPPKKGQESPETKVSKPMVTRSQAKEEASRAGGLRGMAGSGAIGAVCGSSSPARKPG